MANKLNTSRILFIFTYVYSSNHQEKLMDIDIDSFVRCCTQHGFQSTHCRIRNRRSRTPFQFYTVFLCKYAKIVGNTV